MSRHARYASRFEFIREAAFALVLREGPAALTRRAVAAELGVSDATVRRLVAPDVPLVCLAADEVVRRRRRAWLTSPSDAEVATLLVPDARLAPAELVWWRLVLDRSQVEVPTDDDTATLRERYRLADRGTVPARAADPGRDGAPVPLAGPVLGTGTRPGFERYVVDRRLEVARLVERLAPSAGAEHHQLLLAVADGLAVAVCTGRLGPDAARVVLARQLEGTTGQAA